MKELENLLLKTDLKPISKPVLDQLNQFYEHVMLVNQEMNLTALTERRAFAEKHLLDTLFLLRVIKGEKVLDLGTGLGVPGMVLKIVQPELSITLMDALKKRVDYLTETINAFDLEKIDALHGRFEDLAHEKKYRETFDTVVARAVANLPILLEYALPFVKVGGSFIAMKGKNALEELENAKNACTLLGAELELSLAYHLPTKDKRYLLIFKKIKATPLTYPRKPHKIKKKPL